MAKANTRPKNMQMKPLAERRKKTQIVMIRMLVMAVIDLVGICVLMSIRKDANVEIVFVNDWLLPLTAIFGVLTLAAAAYQIVAIAKKIDTSAHLVTPAMLLCITLFCLIACLLYKRVMGLAIAIASAVATVLFLIYCLYMHIFYR